MDLFQLFQILLVDPMTNALIVLSRISFGSFGLAIVIFTVVMRGATFPLTAAQLKTSRAMSVIQPKLQEIQKKYKDPKRRSEETMKLYREAGVNPMGCVLPMLIQFPIWIGLYQTIRRTVGATPESLVDLSHRLYPWSYIRESVPLADSFIGLNLAHPSFVLALVVFASSYVQQKMVTPTTIDQRQQSMNNMMLWMMPLMFGWFTLQVPSGLAVYWVATNIVGIVLQAVYMPERLNWRNLLSFGPAPAQRPAPAHSTAGGGDHPRPEEAIDPTEEAIEAARPAAQRRRKRSSRGRRRGKR
jgi:YidC/Oxa1 family membrane protein insertase